ncbi:MAG: hypothetical protein ACJAQT_004417 [Akkermansiaceae bacterium]|jgi:hypothetical protein
MGCDPPKSGMPEEKKEAALTSCLYHGEEADFVEAF